MADAQDAIRTRLTTHAGTSALIGSQAVFLKLEQNPTLPACIVQQISAPRISAMGADLPQVEGRIQVRSVASTRAGAKALGEQVRAALQRWSGTSASTTVHQCFLADEEDEFDPATRVWAIRQDYMVWWSE